MKEVWYTYQKLDIINRLIIFSGIIACIVLLCKSEGWTALGLLLFMAVFVLVRNKKYVRRYNQQYGHLYYRMPDQEIVEEYYPVVEKMSSEEGKRLEGRKVWVTFPYLIQRETVLDTGFGLIVDIDGFEDFIPPIKRTEITVGGILHRNGKQWILENVEKITRR